MSRRNVSSDTRRRIEALFHRVVELTPEARRATLAGHAIDPRVRAEVEALCELHDRDTAFPIDSPECYNPHLGAPGRGETHDDRESRHVDHGGIATAIAGYRLVRRIGEGGMGVVFEAEQESTRRRVAIKVLRADLVSPQTQLRLQREAEILGLLRHPGIAAVLDAGVAHTGQGDVPFLVLELVDGRPLLEFASSERLDVREKLELVERICAAVEHAHARGVIHRDLKPANVLVEGGRDEHGRLHARSKVLDFGIARVTRADVELTTMHTEVGQVLGTLPYMSPEQVRGDPADVGLGSDVYALGVVLYRLLSGRMPHVLSDVSVPDAAQIVCNDEPTLLGALDARFRGDIEAIVANALEKRPERRYRSARELAEDIRRHLRDEPILARPQTRLYHAWKFAARHRTLFGSLAAVLVALTVATAYSLYQYLVTSRAYEERTRALAEKDAALRVSEGSRLVLESAALLAADPQLALLLALESATRAPGTPAGTAILRALEATLDADELSARFPRLIGHVGAVLWATFSPDGERVATTGADQTARIWDARNGQELLRLSRPAEARSPIRSLAFSPDGLRLLSSEGMVARIWDARDGSPLVRLDGHSDWLTSAAFSPDGDRVVTSSHDFSARIWDSHSGVELLRCEEHDGFVVSACFSMGSSRIVTTANDGRLRIWDARNGELLASWLVPGRPVRSASCRRDGKRVALGGIWGVEVLDVETGDACLVDHPFRRAVRVVGFSADGSLLLAACTDGSVRFLDATTGKELGGFQAHATIIRHAEFAADGSRIVTASKDGTARIWPADLPAAALAYRRRLLTPLERDRYRVGRESERAAFRHDWAPKTPHNLAPRSPDLDDDARGATEIVLASSTFEHAIAGVAHRESHWQIRAADSDYERTPALEVISQNDLETFSVPRLALESHTTYFWRVAHRASNSSASGFSAESSFTTGEIGHQALPIALGALLDRDVIVNPGDTTGDALDDGSTNGGCRLVVDGYHPDDDPAGDPGARGLPRDGVIGVHRLADFNGPNAIRLYAQAPIRIAIPTGACTSVRLLVTGSGGNSGVGVMVEYADGGRSTSRFVCPDWFHDIDRSPSPLEDWKLTAISNGMDRMCGDDLQRVGDTALFDVIIPVDADREPAAITITHEPDAAAARSRARCHVFAVTAMRRTTWKRR